MNRRLYRSRTDSVIGGVAGGVAEYLDVDPSIVRVVWAVLALVTGGIFFVLYIVMWVVVPEAPFAGPEGAPAAADGSHAPPDGEAASAAQATAGGGYAASGGYPARHRRRGGGMIFGLILIGLGVWFLVDAYIPGIDTKLLWPVGLVLLGLVLLGVSMRRPAS